MSMNQSNVEDIIRHAGMQLRVPSEVFHKLYDYQKEGVRFLFRLFVDGSGGILGVLLNLFYSHQSATQNILICHHV